MRTERSISGRFAFIMQEFRFRSDIREIVHSRPRCRKIEEWAGQRSPAHGALRCHPRHTAELPSADPSLGRVPAYRVGPYVPFRPFKPAWRRHRS